MLLVSQLAFHPMFKISTIHQHTSFNPNRLSRSSLGLRTVRDMPLHACAWTSSSFVVWLSNPNVFRLFARKLSHNSQWSIQYNKVQNFNKCFNCRSKHNLRDFLWHCSRLQKNCRLIITNTIENWYSELVEEVVINRFHLKMQLLSAKRRDSGEFIFQYDCHSAQDMLVFWHRYFTR